MRERAARRPPHERRQMLIESAQDAFAVGGYNNTNTADVARGAGVAPAALYRYFPSKRELYLAALRDAGPRLLSIIADVADDTGDPLETIWRVGLAYYDRSGSRSNYARLWFQALGDVSDPEVREAIAANFTATVDLIARLLEKGKRAGIVKAGLDTRVAAWQFIATGLTFDLLHHIGLEDELDRPRVEEWGRRYIDSLREVRDGSR
ncbi:MAG: hypothetical protein C0506_03995 [Anaerolinea sp.]|nr:hypothetical protein [Anaerolinea sp.]